jgi:3-phenylpropionate/trans-cinnamate dioxygenase ferredoxin reductase subunit
VREVSSYYEDILPFYELETAGRYDLAFWRRVCRRFQPRRVLELGSGLGRVTAVLARNAEWVTAIDISISMLARAHRRRAASRLHLVAADMRHLPFTGGFELIVAPSDPFSHLAAEEDRRKALAGVARNLCPTGRFVLDGLYLCRHALDPRVVEPDCRGRPLGCTLSLPAPHRLGHAREKRVFRRSSLGPRGDRFALSLLRPGGRGAPGQLRRRGVHAAVAAPPRRGGAGLVRRDGGRAMTRFKYAIVGGGMTADAAAKGIREIDREGSIGILSTEKSPPYKRPPLTKGLWKGEPVDSIWLDTEKQGVKLRLGRTATRLELAERTFVDDRGLVCGYEKLLLATGGTPRRLPFGDNRFLYYRLFSDYERLRKLAEKHNRFAVIGGGFIGSEIAAALSMNGKDVTLIFPDETIGSRVFPKDLGAFVNARYREKGVTLLTGDSAAGSRRKGKHEVLTTKKGDEVKVDAVIVGIGIQANTDLAKDAGLTVEDGIVVDDRLRASDPHVYAAGDVASFRNSALEKRLRVEHEDNANTMGRIAGRNMAGAGEPYDHLPFFYSDLFEFGYEAVGEVDARLETFADWKEPHREGVIYYLKDGRVRGVLLWNVWNQVDSARRLISAKGPIRPEQLKGRLPEA